MLLVALASCACVAHVQIATGASAAVVPVPGLKDVEHLTNGNFFNLEDLPKTACLIGAGPIGIEMAQTLHRFGCKITIFEVASRQTAVADDASSHPPETRPSSLSQPPPYEMADFRLPHSFRDDDAR